jgi:hypothetical protein
MSGIDWLSGVYKEQRGGGRKRIFDRFPNLSGEEERQRDGGKRSLFTQERGRERQRKTN